MPKHKINTPNAPLPIGPYSQAIVAGKTAYVAGQGPIDPRTGQLVKGSIADEAEQVFQNIKQILQAAGFALSDVVKVTVYLADLADFAGMNEVYKRYFAEPYPARTTVGSQLLLDIKIEVDCIAEREQVNG